MKHTYYVLEVSDELGCLILVNLNEGVFQMQVEELKPVVQYWTVRYIGTVLADTEQEAYHKVVEGHWLDRKEFDW